MWENVRDTLLNKEDFKKQFPKWYIWYHPNYFKKKGQTKKTLVCTEKNPREQTPK